jgi:ferredoxin-NADP reductase
MPSEYDLKIKEIITRTYNTKSVRLEAPAGVSYRAGQFMCVTLKSEPACKRYLSLSSSPTERGYIEFTKKITQSDFSCALDKIKPGDTPKVQYPFGKFTLEDNPAEKIAFISGGIGITPIRSIAKFVVDNRLGTDMALIYSNRSIKEVVFKEDFDAMQKVYPKLKVAHVLCEAAPDFKCTVGLINAQIIRNEIPDYEARKFFLCGPPPMVEAMKKMLIDELGIAQDKVITENFVGY